MSMVTQISITTSEFGDQLDQPTIQADDSTAENSKKEETEEGSLSSKKEGSRVAPHFTLSRFPQRYVIVCMASLGFFISSGMRCNFIVAVFEMTNLRLVVGTHQQGEEDVTVTAPSEFNWNLETISLVESSFLWGYVLTQLPSGYFASKYAANRIFGITLAASAFLNLLIPGAAMLHYGFVIVIRIAQGLLEGFTLPASFGMLQHWAPPLERTRMVMVALFGVYLGAFIGLMFSGFLVKYIKWQAPFYVYSILGISWWLLWLMMCYETPASHPSISAEEKHYIEDSVNPHFDSSQELPEKRLTFSEFPWKQMIFSKPVWAINLASFASGWSFYVSFVTVHTYFKDAFRVEILPGGWITCLGFPIMACSALISGWLSDYVRKKISISLMRKIMTCCAFSLEAICLLALGYSRTLSSAITCLFFAIGFSGFEMGGFFVNHLDLAPQYASILMGISNQFRSVAILLCPYVVKLFTMTANVEHWERVFIVTGSIQLAALIFYGLYSSGRRLPWADQYRVGLTLTVLSSAKATKPTTAVVGESQSRQDGCQKKAASLHI